MTAKEIMKLKFVSMATVFAYTAHHGQCDKSGQPYIYHPKRVALSLTDPIDQAIGWLHDVVEDTKFSFEDLSVFFPDEIVKAVVALTKLESETNDQYYERVLKNERARRVKIADLNDNLSPERLAQLDEKTKKRLIKKYHHGLDVMNGVKPDNGCYGCQRLRKADIDCYRCYKGSNYVKG